MCPASWLHPLLVLTVPQCGLTPAALSLRDLESGSPPSKRNTAEARPVAKRWARETCQDHKQLLFFLSLSLIEACATREGFSSKYMIVKWPCFIPALLVKRKTESVAVATESSPDSRLHKDYGYSLFFPSFPLETHSCICMSQKWYFKRRATWPPEGLKTSPSYRYLLQTHHEDQKLIHY